MRTTSSWTSVGCGIDEMYWLLPKLGLGKVPALSSRRAFGSNSAAGITHRNGAVPTLQSVPEGVLNAFPATRPLAAYIASLFGSVVAGTSGAAARGIPAAFTGTLY